jgi:hypothetical protein
MTTAMMKTMKILSMPVALSSCTAEARLWALLFLPRQVCVPALGSGGIAPVVTGRSGFRTRPMPRTRVADTPVHVGDDDYDYAEIEETMIMTAMTSAFQLLIL